MVPVAIDRICAALSEAYGDPRHGNKDNPLDELAYIILSTRTHGSVLGATYRRLRRAFPRWTAIEASDLRPLEAVLAPAGLGSLKARQLIAILANLRGHFGRATLAPLRGMDDAEAEAFLLALPGVGPKVAKCVLMYSLGREVLPVDTHVHRIAGRIGLRVKRRPDTSQDMIEAVVPAHLRYGLHVNGIAHGRAVCLSRRPRCASCCIRGYCASYRTGRKAA